MDQLSKIIEIAKNKFLNAKGSHRWDHTQRVSEIAEHIAKTEKADIEIVKTAAYLHDIGRTEEDKSNGKICHAELGAKMAAEILKKENFEEEKTQQITHCIETHRFRDNKVPQSLEAKVLFDADKLDSIGAVGIGRAFLFAGENGAHLHYKDNDPAKVERYSKEDTAYNEFLVKLQYVKNKMLTTEGSRIAEERHEFMMNFFDRLNREVDGMI
ncbi:MAG: HD domain-containing protein [Bacteroidota bacterium]